TKPSRRSTIWAHSEVDGDAVQPSFVFGARECARDLFPVRVVMIAPRRSDVHTRSFFTSTARASGAGAVGSSGRFGSGGTFIAIGFERRRERRCEQILPAARAKRRDQDVEDVRLAVDRNAATVRRNAQYELEDVSILLHGRDGDARRTEDSFVAELRATPTGL